MPPTGRSVLVLGTGLAWGDEWVFWLAGAAAFRHARRLSRVEGYAAGTFRVMPDELTSGTVLHHMGVGCWTTSMSATRQAMPPSRSRPIQVG